MEKYKNDKGITLIALVITIIVLLILAGVSIATLTGDNGILTQAREAKEQTEKDAAKEKVEVEVLTSYRKNGTLDNEKLKEKLESISGISEVPDTITDESFPLTVKVDGYNITIDSNGDVTVENLQ